jgi:hypothetical protein
MFCAWKQTAWCSNYGDSRVIVWAVGTDGFSLYTTVDLCGSRHSLLLLKPRSLKFLHPLVLSVGTQWILQAKSRHSQANKTELYLASVKTTEHNRMSRLVNMEACIPLHQLQHSCGNGSDKETNVFGFILLFKWILIVFSKKQKSWSSLWNFLQPSVTSSLLVQNIFGSSSMFDKEKEK